MPREQNDNYWTGEVGSVTPLRRWSSKYGGNESQDKIQKVVLDPVSIEEGAIVGRDL